MLERLPTPWGLVRSGVAPDHPKIKSVTRVYEKTAAHPRFRFFGNVNFGEHVSREELLEHYHAIVYATGSPSDRPLGIPGEDLPGSHAATEFVGWYNGHPDHTDLEFDLLSAERARRDRQRQRRARRRPHARARPRRARPHRYRRPCPRGARPQPRRARSSWSAAAAPPRRPSPTPSCSSSASSRTPTWSSTPRSSSARSPSHDPDAEADVTSPAQRRDPALLRRAPARRAATSAIVLRFLLSPTALLADEHGRLGAVELVRNELVPGPRAAACAPRPPRSARRSPPGWPSARSATAASPSRACPSTSAPP